MESRGRWRPQWNGRVEVELGGLAAMARRWGRRGAGRGGLKQINPAVNQVEGFPSWVSNYKDWKLLEGTDTSNGEVAADVVAAANGSGDYLTIGGAVKISIYMYREREEIGPEAFSDHGFNDICGFYMSQLQDRIKQTLIMTEQPT